jgi:Flp pilus assembly protein TadG
MKRLRRLNEDSESGQAMVEFVLVFPMQLLLTVGIIQFAFIAHAYMVVGQAAFMGARAAAVADVNGMSPQAAAKRQVARTVALLTTGSAGVAGGTIPADGKLEWTASVGRYGFNDDRAREAYRLLNTIGIDDGDGEYWSCDVTFNYVVLVPMVIPIGSGMLEPGTGRPTFRIQRVGYVATPWRTSPRDASDNP